MFVRGKRSGQYEYLQVVHNERHKLGRVRQRVVATLGRVDVLQESGRLDALLASCARFAEHSAVLTAQRQGRVAAVAKVRIGPALVLGRLREELGLPRVLGRLLAERKFGFDVERAVFLTVLHRLFAQGRELFSSLELVFFDTTSIYFEGEGGETLGQYGHSKDHRGDLRQMAVALVGNRGYRKFLRTRSGGGFEIDEARAAWEARFDGKWVLRTDTELSPTDCALRYKDLWMVEQSFRNCKSVLQTRPIYHRCDETIRGHVFCSFLALMLLKELLGRIERRGWEVEWERLRDDLDALEEITIQTAGRSLVVRSVTEGAAGKAIQAAGVALGPAVRLLDDPSPLPHTGRGARSAKENAR